VQPFDVAPELGGVRTMLFVIVGSGPEALVRRLQLAMFVEEPVAFGFQFFTGHLPPPCTA
jgi:hypothetical protein